MTTVAACGGGGSGDDDNGSPDAAPPPVFRNPLPNLSDDEVAMQALQLMGAQVAGAADDCDICHSLTPSKFRAWQTLSDDSMTSCLTNLEVTDSAEAAAMVECMRDPADLQHDFRALRLGVYASGARLPWFEYVFDLAGADYQEFVDAASMPKGGVEPFTQDQFDIVAEWVARGMPLLAELVPEPSFDNCTPSISQAMIDHVNAMETQGWEAVNQTAGINMFGCAGAQTTRDCLGEYPRASDTTAGEKWEQALPGSVMRVLRTNSYDSDYWTRSSADGRFVAHGGSSGSGGNCTQAPGCSTIVDLERDAEVNTSSSYDPGFFPDNSGWMIQGSVAHVCATEVLTATPSPTFINFANSVDGCMNADQIGLYQHMGRALGGGDWFAVAGKFSSDDPGGATGGPKDPPTNFSESVVGLTPMAFDGNSYTQKTEVATDLADTAEMGDTAITPSSLLLFSRVNGAGGGQAGFRVHAINATASGNTYTVAPEVVATYCVNGGKPGFSYDERFMVIHHFAGDADAVDLGFSGPSDPAFASFRNNVANIYLIDLLTGEKTRVTNMQPGQWALYPHFRSDGWMYFMVQTSGHAPEYIVASDAALVVAGD